MQPRAAAAAFLPPLHRSVRSHPDAAARPVAAAATVCAHGTTMRAARATSPPRSAPAATPTALASAPCGDDSDSDDDAAPAVPPGFEAGGCALRWVPFGSTVLCKGAADVVYALTAHIAAATSPSWALRDTLVITGLTKGAGAAGQLAPLLDASWERTPVLLSPCLDADAAAVSRFRVLCGKLASMDKAARVALAADGVRAAYLVPPCAFTEAHFAATTAAPAAQPVDGPCLCAFVLQQQPLVPPPLAAQPQRSEHSPTGQPWSKHVSRVDDAGTAPGAVYLATPAAVAPPAAAAAPVALLSEAAALQKVAAEHAAAQKAAAEKAAVEHAAAQKAAAERAAAGKAAAEKAAADKATAEKVAAEKAAAEKAAAEKAAAEKAAADKAAAEKAAAEKAEADKVASERVAAQKAATEHNNRRLTVSEAALRDALESDKHTYELARLFVDGVPRTDVHLLRTTASGVYRIARPPQLCRAAALFGAQLLAWLRAQHRWCLDTEALRELPQPQLPDGSQHDLRRIAEALQDAVAIAHGRRFLAALVDGAPPAPPPSREALQQADADGGLLPQAAEHTEAAPEDAEDGPPSKRRRSTES